MFFRKKKVSDTKFKLNNSKLTYNLMDKYQGMPNVHVLEVATFETGTGAVCSAYGFNYLNVWDKVRPKDKPLDYIDWSGGNGTSLATMNTLTQISDVLKLIVDRVSPLDCLVLYFNNSIQSIYPSCVSQLMHKLYLSGYSNVHIEFTNYHAYDTVNNEALASVSNYSGNNSVACYCDSEYSEYCLRGLYGMYESVYTYNSSTFKRWVQLLTQQDMTMNASVMLIRS